MAKVTKEQSDNIINKTIDLYDDFLKLGVMNENERREIIDSILIIQRVAKMMSLEISGGK